jgi:plastocyanin
MYRRVFGLTGLVLVAAALPFVPGNVIAGPDKVNFPAEYTLSFDEAGTYEYICGLHPTMKGTIEVTK